MRKGLVIPGSIMLGAPWALGVSIAGNDNFSNESGWLLIPGVGPWITLAARKNCTTTLDNYCSSDDLRGILILDGLVQTAGAAMLFIGLLVPKTEVVRMDVSSVRVVPVVAPGQTGLVATGNF